MASERREPCQINEVAGAFAGLGMGLNGVLTAILLPAIFRLFAIGG
jgi:putative effector of murein hydrolase